MLSAYQQSVYEMRTRDKPVPYREIAIILGHTQRSCEIAFAAAKAKVASGDTEAKEAKSDELNLTWNVKREVRAGIRCSRCWLLFTPSSDCTPSQCGARDKPYEQIDKIAYLFLAIDSEGE